MRLVVLITVFVVAVAGPVLAQDWISPYIHGATGFEYAQLPFGPYAGLFSASGWAFGVSGTEPETFSEAVGGFYAVAGDTASVAGYAATRNPDETVDLFVWWIRVPGSSVPAGSYAVDLFGFTTVFVYLDDIEDFVLPKSFDPGDLADWLGLVSAAHIFVAASGHIDLDFVDIRAVTGTFSGSMLDDSLTLISVTNGMVSLTGEEVGTVPASWGEVKTLYR
jgi:hypothetical protein